MELTRNLNFRDRSNHIPPSFQNMERLAILAEFNWVSDDDFLQALEFGLVERELIQAVGRARLLENECEVQLFSNYVLSGGELWKVENHQSLEKMTPDALYYQSLNAQTRAST